MAIAPLENPGESDVSLGVVYAALVQVADSLTGQGRMLSRSEAVRTLVDVEDISRVVDFLQVFAAGMAEENELGSGERPHAVGSLQTRAEQSLDRPGTAGAAGVGAPGGSVADDASGSRFRTCADYLRSRLGISRAEAKRRLDLAHSVLPGIAPSGAFVEPQSAAVSAAFASGTLSGRAATVICSAVDRVRCLAAPEQLASMEHHLTRQALESDEDVLRVVARRWETVLDQDGREPTEKVLRSRQGVFLRGRRNGLRILEIGATDEQFEHLITAMSTATNPRTPNSDRTPDDPQCLGGTDVMADGAGGGGDGGGGSVAANRMGGPTRAQSLLDGLVGACRIALSTSLLPATGGHRPQVMVTIDYRDLLGDVRETTCNRETSSHGSRRGDTSGHAFLVGPRDGSGTGRAVFAEQLSARTIRRIACDADLIPLVLGGDGQILDMGRAGRLFPPHMRRALVARDRGCAFPDCTVPATWCEAHHMTPWSRGGTTSIDNGVLLCAHHHHTIHDGLWTVASHNGIPWFTPPPHFGRHGTTARRNRYWYAQPGVEHGAIDTVPSGD
ncbi:HNH endonuclease signature motif containing protein [Arthrobacter sp. L77]|uniref:HNH endonuclease signature motif containing protein n=1 Tax=Arthrobacter sp. L77 TaxID=1496689 RepID=UPI0006909983|nr:HNH endonuclease signature motif containing protein [Arthrobacter sp. L77]